MSKLTDQLRKQLAELTAQREAITTAAAPLRAEYDLLWNESRAKLKELGARIKEVETGRFDLDMDISRLTRALGGRRFSDAANRR